MSQELLCAEIVRQAKASQAALDELKTAKDAAYAAVLDGGDSGALVSFSVNGKTFTFSEGLSVENRFGVLSRAYDDASKYFEVPVEQRTARGVGFNVSH